MALPAYLRPLLAALLGLALPWSASGDALEDCASQFIDGLVENAPTLYSSLPTEPYRTNRHHCYRTDSGAHFALEFWPTHQTARWVAYKLDDRYGPHGCGTRPRDEMQCYFSSRPWPDVEACVESLRDDDPDNDASTSDPFHPDPFLVADGIEALGTRDFTGTGHDRGHLAPNNAFSHDLCATYHTFSMANMSPQRANLNRTPWRNLEAQVLYWGAEHGPVYVITGPIFNKFPTSKFTVFNDGTYDPDLVYAKNRRLTEFNPGDDRVADIRMPTGYYKVIYREPTESEPAHAIGFLMPHTTESLDSIWHFVARIDVIEEASGLRLHAISEDLKEGWGDPFFLERNRGSWRLRVDCGNDYSAANWLEDSTPAERLETCALR
jgi:DNA/RNA endonuclease G (NUC1)